MRYTRSRTGCLTCRKDGYKCDEQRPYCGRCVRLRKSCAGYELQLRWKEVAGASKAHASMRASPPKANKNEPIVPRSLDLSPNSISSLERKLLHHWTTALASLVSMAPTASSNPYLIHLNPLLVESIALRSAILSMSATHLSCCSTQSDSSMAVVAQSHRLAAISNLQRTIETAEPHLSLATVLILRTSDRLFITADDSPADHLAGAKAIIERTNQGGLTLQRPETKFLLGAFLYQDILTSVSHGSSPYMDIDRGVLMEDLETLSKLTAVLRIVGQISRLSTMSDIERGEVGTQLHDMLLAMEDEVGTTTCDDHSLTAEAYRHAAFIYHLRVDFNIGAPHPLTLHHADSCLDILSQVSVTSSALAAHIWPLWTAGCESISMERRQFVRDRLQQMFYMRGIPSIERLRGDIEEVWRVKDIQRESTGVDGIDCIKAIRTNRRRTADII